MIELNPEQYLAKIIEAAKQIDPDQSGMSWGDLDVTRDTAYQFVATSIVGSILAKYNDPAIREILIVTLVKALAENFALTLRLGNQNGCKTV